MTNGNDILEFEENNLERLEEEFLMGFDFEDLKNFVLSKENVIRLFKESRKVSWDEFVEMEYSTQGVK